VLDLLVTVLPEIVRSASEPLSNVDKISIISTEGASDLSRTVAANVAQGLEISTDLTGVDIRALLGRLGGAAATGTAGKAAAAPVNGRPTNIDLAH
jgi:flotillin